MKKRIATVVVFLVIGAAVVGLYYYFLNRESNDEEGLYEKKTAVEELIDMDLDVYYPATVKTVMETYCEFLLAFYNEDYTEDEYAKLIKQYRKLMDDELLTKNPEEQQMVTLKADIDSYEDEDKVLFSYRFLEDKEIKETVKDDKTYATVDMSFGMKVGGSTVETAEENFILRKDSNNKWKILGWKLRDRSRKEEASASPATSPSGDE